jgi:hypothetical protein
MNTQKENFGLVGRTWIKKVTQANPEGELVDYIEKDLLEDGSAFNAIFSGVGTTSPTGLKAYLAESMSSVIDRALNNLFTAHTSGAGENNKDGIVVMGDLGDYNNATAPVWTMITTVMATTTPFARKWKGTATVAGSPVQWSAAAIGWTWTGNAAPNNFTTTYATQSFTTVTLGVGESLVIEWEIAIA